MRIKKTAGGDRSIALLHTSDNTSILSFWGLDSFHFKHAITLNSPCTKVVFEKSHRYFAALTTSGSVEVWQIRGEHEVHHWDLRFKSVRDIQTNSHSENQFFVLMNAVD